MKKDMNQISQFIKKYAYTIVYYALGITLLSLVIAVARLYNTGFPEELFGANNEKVKGEFVSLAMAVFGGLLVLLGLIINSQRVREQTRQNEIMERSNINTRFKDAAMLLSSETTSATLSGIHALIQIARETKNDKSHKGYAKIIHDILCAFIRESSNTDGKRKCADVVIQTIIDELFKNNANLFEEYKADLCSANLNVMDLIGAKLIGAKLIEAKLNETDLNGAKLIGAELIRANLINAKLIRTNLINANLVGANLSGANLNRANLSRAKLNRADLIGANLDGANLDGANLTGTILEKNDEANRSSRQRNDKT